MGQNTSAGGWDVLLGFEEWETLGLRSIAAYLLQHGATVKIVPLPAPADSVLATIRSKDPGLLLRQSPQQVVR